MSDADRAKWDKRWQTTDAGAFTPAPLLTSHAHLLTGGVALDLACGLGQNSIWLARHNYRVLAVDVSGVALAYGRAEAARQGVGERIQWLQSDMDHWTMPTAAFNLIAVFRFLDRRLYRAIPAGLRPGGLLFYETRHSGFLQRMPGASRDFLLQPGELQTAFANLNILYTAEDDENAALVARKTPPIEIGVCSLPWRSRPDTGEKFSNQAGKLAENGVAVGFGHIGQDAGRDFPIVPGLLFHPPAKTAPDGRA
jgi:tellurite methyltransferase